MSRISFRVSKAGNVGLSVVLMAGVAASASAQSLKFTPLIEQAVTASVAAQAATASAPVLSLSPQTAAPAPVFTYSDAYRTRAKIHKTLSVAMLPLVATQGLLGMSIYNNPTDTKKAWHQGVAWGIGGLFAANTVTGAWNLIEGRKDPEHRKLRIAHGLLMMAADAGFAAALATAPESRQADFAGQKSTHRAIAFTSVGLATTGYLLMLFGHR